jgi:putative flavoprotein involved in K+ transport
MNRQSGVEDRTLPTATGSEHFETVIIGGGQAGLATGYHLAKRDLPFVILDANERIGDSWRKRWDSLRLFTPARYSGLPGWPFPAPRSSYPTKDDVADYLEAYAARFDLPVRAGVEVDGLSREGNRYVLVSGDRRFEANNVVVATGAYQTPRVPTFAPELDPGIVQLHSREYRDPSQLREGGVLVVGAGNSGAEIAFEVSRTHPAWLSGRDTGHIPVPTGSVLDRLITPPFWFVASRVLTMRTPIGRTFRPKLLTMAAPLERVRPKELAAAGIERVPKTAGVRDGSPALEDGRVMEVSNVIWCTGFRPDFRWIDLPVFGEDGPPLHERGVVVGEPGLYFVGLFFLYAFTSSLIGGVGRDADHIAKHIASREPNGRPTPHAPAGGADAQSLRGSTQRDAKVWNAS